MATSPIISIPRRRPAPAIRTTLNIYTQAVPDALRQANSKVVEMLLPEKKTA
jgi:hypothetical protein